jgi:hypothetical protein
MQPAGAKCGVAARNAATAARALRVTIVFTHLYRR